MPSKKTGEIFKPGQDVPMNQRQPKIVGAAQASEKPPKTLDSRTPSEPVPVETKSHMDAVSVREHVRSRPKRKGEPELRARTYDREKMETWEKTRRAEEE